MIFLAGSHISLYPSLNFVVYVPSQKHTPLHMKTKDGKKFKIELFKLATKLPQFSLDGLISQRLG